MFKSLLLIPFPENFVPVLKPVRITLLFHLGPNFDSFRPFRPVDIFRPVMNLLINTEKFCLFQVLMAITWIEPPIAVHLTFGPLQVEWLAYSSLYSRFPPRRQLPEWTQSMAEAAAAAASSSFSSFFFFFFFFFLFVRWSFFNAILNFHSLGSVLSFLFVNLTRD